MTLYNCRIDGDQWRISKFSNHGELESTYLTTHHACQCPAGVRDTCRHRLMLPTFLEEGLVNTNLFLDWDNGLRIVDFNGLPATVQSNETCEPDLAPQALTDTCASAPAEPAELSPNSIIDDLPMTHSAHSYDSIGRITLPPTKWRRF